MGDWFQCIADIDATESQAPKLRAAIQAWLVAEGIVRAELRACVLSANVGHPPGPRYAKAAEQPDDSIFRLVNNGLAIIPRRTVFHCGQGGFELVCSSCLEYCDPPDEWGDAVDDWYKGTGPGILACPCCGHARPITQWQHDPPWAFAYLGLEFWNWPTLSESFVNEVRERLGHRVVVVAGKL